jgi:hypothetical protein
MVVIFWIYILKISFAGRSEMGCREQEQVWDNIWSSIWTSYVGNAKEAVRCMILRTRIEVQAGNTNLIMRELVTRNIAYNLNTQDSGEHHKLHWSHVKIPWGNFRLCFVGTETVYRSDDFSC